TGTRQAFSCGLRPTMAPSTAPTPTSSVLRMGPSGDPIVASADMYARRNPNRPPSVVQRRAGREIQPNRSHAKPASTTHATPPTNAPISSPPRPTACPTIDPSTAPRPPSRYVVTNTNACFTDVQSARDDAR